MTQATHSTNVVSLADERAKRFAPVAIPKPAATVEMLILSALVADVARGDPNIYWRMWNLLDRIEPQSEAEVVAAEWARSNASRVNDAQIAANRAKKGKSKK